MHIENPLRLVRELKGAPLSIIMALSLVKQRVKQEWLERATGYTDKPVSQALGYLEEIGMVDHNAAGWILIGAWHQLPLAMPQIEETQPEPEIEPEAPELSPAPVDNSDVSRNISDSSVITYLLNKDNKELNKQVSNNGGKSRNFSDSPGEFSNPETWQALTDAGIRGKKRHKLAGVVSASEVQAWHEHLKREKGSKYKPGLLIYWLESGSIPPVLPEQQESDDRSKYTGGAYADYINS